MWKQKMLFAMFITTNSIFSTSSPIPTATTTFTTTTPTYLIFLFSVLPWILCGLLNWRVGYVPDLHGCIGIDKASHEWRGNTEAFRICRPKCLEFLRYPVYDWMCERAALGLGW